MFTGWVLLHFGTQNLKRTDQPWSGFSRFDHLVNLTQIGGVVGVEVAAAVISDKLLHQLSRILGGAQFFTAQNAYCAFCPHHRNLGRGPGKVEIAAQLFA